MSTEEALAGITGMPASQVQVVDREPKAHSVADSIETQAYDIDMSAGSLYAYVTNSGAVRGDVQVAPRTRRVVCTFAASQGPALLASTPDGRTICVAYQLSNTVSVIDAASRRITVTIAVALQPHGVSVTADGKYVYVASIAGHAITIIRASDDRVVAIVPSPAEPNEVATVAAISAKVKGTLRLHLER